MESPSSSLRHRDDPTPLAARHKRRGVALSCAECRRLKLKCSRVFPCSNCVKKGCSAICPDGSLTTGKGNRFVLANTEALHDKINQLSNRVRQLEDALMQSHASNSNQPHPLLSDELLQIKRPLERERLDTFLPKEAPVEPGDAIDAMGSLSISQGGRSTFFGQTANSWYLLQNEGSEDENDALGPEVSMPSDVPWLNHAFPFASSVRNTADDVRGSILSLLPSAPIAKHLCNIYFRHAAWMYTPIQETDFYDNIFRPVYDPDAPYQELIDSHSLAILFMALALGCLLDLEREAYSPEAMQYCQLARAMLSVDSVLDEQTIPGIQALILMCHFMFLANMSGPRWVIMGIIVKSAHSVGLHRDSGKWNLNPEETVKRRALFYELLTYDAWQSLTFGRPPSLSTAHFDSQFPEQTSKNAAGEVEMSFASWKHRFSSQCLSVVFDKAFGARPPNYKTVQELDRKVRTYYIPPSLQVPGFGGAKIGVEVGQPTVELTMQRYIAFAIKEITLFYMHRGFFAQALEDSPTDPMGSKYAPSVLAAYTSACSFVGLVESLFKQHPMLTERMWFLFTHVFSCAIVLGSIAVKSQMALAPSALSHLESALILFSQVSDTSRAGKILPILQKLKDRAHSALLNYQQCTSPETATRMSYYGPSIKKEVDELTVLGGMTRLVSRRKSASPSTPSYSGSSPQSQHASPPLSVQEPPIYHAIPQTSTWQDYGHVQNFEPYSQYHIINGTQQTVPYSDARVSSHPMTGDSVMPEYYGYSPGGGYIPMQSLQAEDIAPPVHDLTDTWHNFMSQFK